MKTYKNFKKSILITGSTLALSLVVVTPTFASSRLGREHILGAGKMGVVGEVISISGSNINLVGKYASTTSYIVDASAAKIEKNGTPISVNDIQAHDVLLVRGVVTGNNVAATEIVDGKKNRESEHLNKSLKGELSFGTITAINGSNFTLESSFRSKKTVAASTVNSHATTTSLVVTNAQTVFKKNGKVDSATSLTLGEKVVIIGPRDPSTNTITASSVNTMAGVLGGHRSFKTARK